MVLKEYVYCTGKQNEAKQRVQSITHYQPSTQNSQHTSLHPPPLPITFQIWRSRRNTLHSCCGIFDKTPGLSVSFSTYIKPPLEKTLFIKNHK